MKQIIYLATDCFYAFILCVYQFKRIFFSNKIKRVNNKFDKAIVLANGPSLKKDIEAVLDLRKSAHVYAVNYFAVTNFFRLVKPEYYLLSDRAYWSNEVSQEFKDDTEEIFNELVKVDWKLTVICPKAGYKFISKRLQNNPQITVESMYQSHLDIKNPSLYVFLMRLGVATPYFINALVIEIWHALNAGYKNIRIYGADFTLFKEYYVDQESNQIYSTFSHYYKNSNAQSNALHRYGPSNRKMMHQRLLQQSQAFNQIYLMSILAKKKNMSLLNCSSTSFIDSLVRR